MQRRQMRNRAMGTRHLACALLLVLGISENLALAQDLPRDAASQIRAAWAEARKNWIYNARFLHLGFERESAKEGFETDYGFGSESIPGLYHIKRGPKGSSAALNQGHENLVLCMLTSKIIDPAQAVSVARAHGMKGNVLKAMLECWGSPAALEVWRVVPDNDPAEDPNDPNMKNYIIDAMTGSFYSDSYFKPTHVDPAEFMRSFGVYTAASLAEFMEGVRAATQ